MPYENENDDNGATPYSGTVTEDLREPGFSAAPAPLSENDLVERMENVALKSNDDIGDDDGEKDAGLSGGSGLLPLRPYAGDCPHYVRTGACKFGLSCRYNHPIKKVQQVFNGGDPGSDKLGMVECKYFSTPGGCKYGNFCRYSHPGEEVKLPELNFLGLPKRLGEKECPYYVRTGSCGYGPRCVYHHPDPISMEGNSSPNLVDEKFVKRADSLSENHNGGSLHLSGTPKPYQAPWSSPKLSDNFGLYSGNLSSSPLMGKQLKWNGYQAPSYLPQIGNSYSSPVTDGSFRNIDINVQVDEFPERPGQPECDYFMKTGNCKFKSTCRFHHPKNRTSKSDEFVLNENGLPLRPGRSICRHYERHGLCKFGHACLFDHPTSHGLSAYPNWCAPAPAPAPAPARARSDGGGWDN